MGKVVLIACTNVGRAIIEAIQTGEELKDVELVGVVNLKPDVAVTKANYDSYVDLKQKYHLNVYFCENVNEPECIEFIKRCAPDVIIQSGWSQKFGKELLELPKYACIGEHPAPLPKGRGAACINWAIITGEKAWGDTFFKMEMEYDTGLIYSQEHFNIELYDDVKTVYDKVAAVSAIAVKKHLSNWANGLLNGIQQDDSQSTHYPRRKPADGEFDFSQPAMSVYNQIRGQARPYPGAFFYKEKDGVKQKITVWKASLDTDCKEDGGLNVLCGDGNSIRLLRVQAENEAETWAVDVLS